MERKQRTVSGCDRCGAVGVLQRRTVSGCDEAARASVVRHGKRSGLTSGAPIGDPDGTRTRGLRRDRVTPRAGDP